MLGTTTTAVNSGLRRARAQLARVLPEEDDVAEPAEPELRALLDRFAVAFENGDVTALTALLREDVALEMPPMLTWFAGREDVRRFLASKLFGRPGQFRLVPTMANGQPAFAAYQREHDGVYRAHAALVLTIAATGITRIVIFLSPGLLGAFGLPQEYDPDAARPARDPAAASQPAATSRPAALSGAAATSRPAAAPDLAVPSWPR
jgi:RNA polymerase sigma-70 factor (ECF subfamily)